MRLDKLLSNMGVGSRKEVKALLKKKQVTVNGVVSKDSGEKIDPNKDEIAVNGEIIRYQQYIYSSSNKYTAGNEWGNHSLPAVYLFDDE